MYIIFAIIGIVLIGAIVNKEIFKNNSHEKLSDSKIKNVFQIIKLIVIGLITLYVISIPFNKCSNSDDSDYEIMERE